MPDNKAKILRLRQTKVNLPDRGGKVTGKIHNTEVSKRCPTCENPRWEKTSRHT